LDKPGKLAKMTLILKEILNVRVSDSCNFFLGFSGVFPLRKKCRVRMRKISSAHASTFVKGKTKRKS
jgi:hypothetical protein